MQEELAVCQADLVFQGHHSYEEVGTVAGPLLYLSKRWADSLRDSVAIMSNF